MTITINGETFPAYVCKRLHCTMKFISRQDAEMCEALHVVRDLTFRGTENQRRQGHVKSTKPRPRKRILVTGAGMGRIKLTDYSHGRKKH